MEMRAVSLILTSGKRYRFNDFGAKWAETSGYQ
jgi:hypothetical protein